MLVFVKFEEKGTPKVASSFLVTEEHKGHESEIEP